MGTVPDSPWTDTVGVRDSLRAAVARLRDPGVVRRLPSAVRGHLAAAPAATAYAFTLVVTWWTLRGLGPVAERALILSASTNLHNMRQDPVQVLIASAFWVEGGFPWATLTGFLVVMAAAERWLGTFRWIVVFATGHIGATLLTVTGIDHAIDRGLIPNRVALAADVGTSYGFTAVVAVLAFRFRGRVRAAWAAVLVTGLVAALWLEPTFTDYGHLCAALIGFVIGIGASTLRRHPRTAHP